MFGRTFTRKEWVDSILLCSTELEHLTWTNISGGIRCWEQFNSNRDAVKDPQSTADVLAMWGTRSYFDARASAWGFDGKLELPTRTAQHSDVLEMAREAFHAAAGLPSPNKWPRGMAFLAVHCEISEMMSADNASAIRIPLRGLLQAGQSKSFKWETWLPTWDWCPLRGGLCGNEEFESASTEAGSEGSGWLEIFVHGKLGKNNAGRLADARQARAQPLFRLQFGPGPASSAHTHSS
jgi:hypothetical protein